jgi:hypothetical protein
MTYYAGFDSFDYPTYSGMEWLHSNTNLVWCGYYLAPAPNRPSSPWSGAYNSISSSWGIVPIYVGQQDSRTAREGYTPSSILTLEQGASDANDAIDLLLGEGFPVGGFLYLDWEYGGLDGQGSDYVKSWISTVASDGRVHPGIYCSHVVAQAIADLIVTINPTPKVQFWCWKVCQSDPHPFGGDIANIPEIDPTCCGFTGARSWQREQNAIVTFPNGAPLTTLKMDFSTSSLSNPGGPSEALAAKLSGRMEVVLRSGDRIILGRDFDAFALARLVEVLRRPKPRI